MRLFQHGNQPEKNYVSCGRTHIGMVRTSNQDALIEAGPLVGVADGMGGHQGGETASADARDALIAFAEGKTPDAVLLRQGIEAANRAVYDHAHADPALNGMGTTLTALWVGEKEVFLGHVGDSRCYLWRNEALIQLSQDHSLVADMVRTGMITPEQAAHHPMRNIITRAVGTQPTVEVDTDVIPRMQGDLYLVCSDGLYGMVEDEVIAEILHSAGSDREAAESLVEEALVCGGPDNVTVMLLRDERGPGKEAGQT